MPKISISMPTEILNFVDQQGLNRSQTIVGILKTYYKRQHDEELAQDYGIYADLPDDDDALWEKTVLTDMGEV